MVKFINKFTLSIIGFYIFWLGVMPFVFSKGIEIFCNNFSHNSIYEIQIEKPRVYTSFLPNLTVKSETFILKSKNGETNIDIQNAKVKFRLLPLFSGRLHINSIELDDFYFEQSLKKRMVLDKNFFNNLDNAKIILDTLKIDNFKVLLHQAEIKAPIVYEGNKLDYCHRNRYLKLVINSSLAIGNNISTSNMNLYLPKNNDIKKTVFDIDISNLNLEAFKVYLKHYLPEDLKDFRGIINIKANKDELITELNNCALVTGDLAKSIILPKKLNIKSKFNIKRQVITLDYVDILSKNINASVSGKIFDYFGKSMPTVDLDISINKSRVEDFVSLLPVLKLEEIDTYKLKKYKFYGDVLANFSIKGRLPEPDVVGDVYIDNGILTKPIPNAHKGATIKLDFIGKYLNFDVVVPVGQGQKVLVKGGQELYNIKYADLSVRSSDKVDLAIAQSVVCPLHEILNFMLGPVPDMNFSGNGNIDIIVKGNRKNPHVWGNMNFYDMTVSFINAPNFILTKANALLKFKDQDAIFENQTGVVNGKDFKINGACNLQGKFDFEIFSNEQPAQKLYYALNTTTLIPEIKKMIPQLEEISGLINLKLKVFGVLKDIEDLQFGINTFAKGDIEFVDNSFTIQNIDLLKTNGVLKFDTTWADANIKSSIGNSPMSIVVKVRNNYADLVMDIPKLNPNFLLRDDRLRSKQYLPYVSAKAKYKGMIDNIEYDKIIMNAKVLSSNPDSILKFNSGDVVLANNKLSLRNIKGYFNNPKNAFNIDLRTEDAFTGNPLFNGSVNIKAPDISLLNDLMFLDILPEGFLKFIKNYELKKGTLDLTCKVFNNFVNASTDISGISFVYVPLDLPIEVVNGGVAIRNNVLKLNKINILADGMPILVDGDVKDIFDKQIFNLYFNSKPQQEFIDKYINEKQIYPLKIKGDIVCLAKLKGVKDDFDLKTEIDMSKDSSIYHFGAFVGDVENAIEVSLESRVLGGNNFKIKEFSYDKKIDSQSGKQTKLNMLKTSGGLEVFKDDLAFKDLKIKTTNPTDARIFNIIFRKPNIKQGMFTSDIKINGKLSNPKVIGDFHIFETAIPFFDTTMKNIELVFRDKLINFSSKGEVLGNEIVFDGTLRNKLSKPYYVENASLYAKNLDLNHVVNKLKTSEVEELSATDAVEGVDLSSVVAKNFKLKADNVQLRNIRATNFEASTSLSEKGLFDVNEFVFNIAQGTLKGKYKYNLQNDDQAVSLVANNISANDITWALFDLNNQIYGDMTGNVNLSCNGVNFQNCMETLSGNGDFVVKDGKMPKLGSLEYLLKAGNLLKGGLTGISINSVIDLISPLKTGEFEMIAGNFRIKDGVARNVEIASKGKDLGLYTQGTYNFATSIAEMQVYGLLSKKISTFLGPIGNMSINTLFNVIPGVDLSKDSLILEKINKIPGVELSSKAHRRFVVDIKGNINGEDYVTSFKWIN